MARVLLTRALRLLCVAGLGALALAGAAGPGVCATGGAAGGPVAATASTGDRWIWPGPPDAANDRFLYYDPGRHAVALLGDGWSIASWTLSPDPPRTWTPSPAGSGVWPLRYRTRPLYDAASGRVIAINYHLASPDTCCTFVYQSVVEQLSPGTGQGWSEAGPYATVPHWRDQSFQAIDTRRHRLLVWGGRDESDGVSLQPRHFDVFDLSPAWSGWSGFDLAAAAPPYLAGYAAYDSLADRLVAFGGMDSSLAWHNDVYTLDLASPTAWQKWTVPDSMDTPFYGSDGQLVLDGARNRLLFITSRYPFEGIPIDSPAPESLVVWQLDLATGAGWTAIPYAGPSPDVSGGSVAFDPERNRLTLYGCGGRSDLYELVLDGASAWALIQRSDIVPRIEEGSPVFLDRRRARVVTLPGLGGYPWILDRGAYDAWERGPRSLVAPPVRDFSAAVFDTTTRTGYAFGGRADGAYELGDLWRFTIDDSDHVAWERLYLDGDVPSPRWGATAVLDPIRRRMILFGGFAGRPLADTWELTLDPPMRWRRLPDRGMPPGARFWASAVYDSRRDAMIVYGGNTGDRWNWQLSDGTWALSFTDGDVWTPVAALGRPPAPRCGQGAVYDPRRDRMLIFWGAAYNGTRIDCGELDLADGPTWRDYSPAGVSLVGRAFFNPVYDPDRDQALVLGGEFPSGGSSLGIFALNVYADFSGNPVTAPPPLHGPSLALLGLLPNPTRDVESVAFDLPVDADVRARIYDASGRLVRDLGSKRYVAGRHLWVWDGRNDAGAAPASGVYFARLSVLGRTFSGKFVLLR